MKTKLGLLLLMLLLAVGCEDSIHSGEPAEQAAEPTAEQPAEQTQQVPADPPVIQLPSITNTIGMTFNEIPAGTFMMGSPETEKGRRRAGGTIKSNTRSRSPRRFTCKRPK